MKSSVLETLLGAIVLVLAGFFVTLAYSTSDITTSGGYPLHATFDKVDGVKVGSDVRLAGIKIGSVTAITLDSERFVALMTITVQENVQLPLDSVIEIASEGLLGGNYVSITPGGDMDVLAAGDRFQFSQSPVNLADLLGRFVFSAGEGGANSSAPATAPSAVADEF